MQDKRCSTCRWDKYTDCSKADQVLAHEKKNGITEGACGDTVDCPFWKRR